jgi:hypothetical protein
MATEKQIAANRANALLSTGPRTAAGRARSSMNSYRDGMRSRKRKALREESYVAENRKHKWMAIGDPCNDIAEFLMYQNVCASFEIEHAVRVNSGRSTKTVENSDDKEIEAAQALGRRLFHDRRGPTGAYGNLPHVRTNEDLKRHTSSSGKGDDPDDPAKLVAELEKTAPGCIWMREQWEELREQLNRDVFQSIDRFTATRLLGRQPADISFDRDVAVNFVAGEAVDPSGKTEFDDLLSDFREEQVKRLRKKLHKRWPELFEFVEVSPFKQLLGELIDEQIERLRAMEEEFKTNAEEIARAAVADSKHDQTPETYRLLNYVKSARRELRLGIAAFEKYNKGQKDRVESSPRRTKEDEGRVPRPRARTGGGMPEDADLAWAYAAETVGDRGGSGGGPGIDIPGYVMSPAMGASDGARVECPSSIDGATAWRPSVQAGAGAGDPRPTTDGGGPGIHIPGCVMPPPLEAQGAEAGGGDGGGPGIHIPGYVMPPPFGARGGARMECPSSIDGATAWRPSVQAGAGSGDPRPTTHAGAGLGDPRPTTHAGAGSGDPRPTTHAGAGAGDPRPTTHAGAGAGDPRPTTHAGAGAGDPRPITDGVGPGIDIPGCKLLPSVEAQDLALVGNESLDVVAMASAPGALCGADSGMEVEVTPAGGNVAGETSEPNFDENVRNEESSAAVDVKANSFASSGLDKRGESQFEIRDSPATKMVDKTLAASPGVRGLPGPAAATGELSQPHTGSDEVPSGQLLNCALPRSP